MIEHIYNQDVFLALIIRHQFCCEGIKFFTPPTSNQHVGYMNRPPNHVIPPHTHIPLDRTVSLTQEVLYIKSGRVRLDLYNKDISYFESRILSAGDVVLLADGGHGFTMLEQSEIIEVKQGPYAGELDKVRFQPILDNQLIIK